jgi:hypothetical protein
MDGRFMACVGGSLTVAFGNGAVGPPVMEPGLLPGGRGAPATGFCKGMVGAPVSVRAAGAAGFWLSGRVAAGRPAIGGAAGRRAPGALGGLGAVGGPPRRVAGGGIGAEGAEGARGGDTGGVGSLTGDVLALGAGGGSGAEGS